MSKAILLPNEWVIVEDDENNKALREELDEIKTTIKTLKTMYETLLRTSHFPSQNSAFFSKDNLSKSKCRKKTLGKLD